LNEPRDGGRHGGKAGGKPEALSAERTRSLIGAALPAEVRPPGLDLEALSGGHDALVRSLPPWVERYGLLAGAGHYCLLCEPRSAPDETFPSQMILDIPRGRYFVDRLDIPARTWVSRESAEGGPLVAGLPYIGNPILAWIRPRPGVTSSPLAA
jgi:hypothetical protein